MIIVRINYIFVRMTTKLTLSVDHSLIAQANAYAKNNGTSVSKMVEQYLRSVLKSSKDTVKSKSDILDALTGILEDPGPNWNEDDARYEYFKKKYDL